MSDYEAKKPYAKKIIYAQPRSRNSRTSRRRRKRNFLNFRRLGIII